MTAFGTVCAVFAAVGIAIWSNYKTNRRVEAERVEADRRLREERASANERLQRQFDQAEQLEQHSEAAAVTVVGPILRSDEDVTPEREKAAIRPGAFVINKGRYAIRNVEARLSLDDGSLIELGSMEPLMDPSALPQPWTADLMGMIGQFHISTIAPGQAMQFLGDATHIRRLPTSFLIVRWTDRWDVRWEYRNGEVHKIEMSAEWRP